jgi:hypothetical protein
LVVATSHTAMHGSMNIKPCISYTTTTKWWLAFSAAVV